MAYIAVLGHGVVGSGVLEVLTTHAESIRKRAKEAIEVKYILDLKEFPGLPYSDRFVKDFNVILNDPEVRIVVEVMGGLSPAYDFVKACFENGKSVVTSNKELVAKKGAELLHIAQENNLNFLFEASVGGGIPIIDPMKHSLIANRIDTVMGIVNGTTNYMLTRMAEDDMPYDEVLAEAQAKGFAEADPTADVDGLDAAAKIAILASIAFNSRVTINDVHTEGIRNITPLDLEIAKDMGYSVKLLAHAHRTDEGIDVRVHPTMLPLDHQLSTVNGVFNAIYVVGDAVGETMFFGEGAGSGPAASAVMGDVLEVARHIQAGIPPIVGCTCTDTLPIVPMENLKTKYYIRFAVADRSGVLAAMAGVFADHNVSVHSVIQRGKKDANSVDLTYVTHTAREKSVRAVLADIASLDDVLREEPSVIRVED